MAHHDDPPWLRPVPTLVLSSDGTGSLSPKRAESPTITTPHMPSLPNSSHAAQDDSYAGWRPQQTMQAPLSPLDLAMFPGAPVQADPIATRKAVAGLRPLRILSSRRPGGPSSAGPSRPPSTDAAAGTSKSGFMNILSAAKRVSGIATPSYSSSSHSSPGASTQPPSGFRAPIPVSPLPPPRSPPTVPRLYFAPEHVSQIEPALKAYLESLVAQAPSNTPASHRLDSSQPGPIGLTEEDEDIMLEIRDLDSGGVVPIRNLDVVNRESQSTSQRSPSISEFTVVRDLDTQPRTPPLAHPPLTPPSLSPTKLLSPVLLVPNPRHSRHVPVTPLTEATYLNHNLEASLSDLERALGYPSISHSRSDSASTFSSSFGSQRSKEPRTQPLHTPRTARTTSSHASSVFSSRTIATPLTTPPASPPPLPHPYAKRSTELPCIVCSRPMQNMTSTRCGHVFCRGCVQGRSACPVCRSTVQDDDLRAIHLFM